MNSENSVGTSLHRLLNLPGSEEIAIHVRVRRYIASPSAVEHEALRATIERFYGSSASRFFDEEGTLPLINEATFVDPNWPMHPWEAASLRLAHVAFMGATLFVVAYVSISNGLLAWTLPFAVAGGALASLATRTMRRWLPPRDLSERARLESKYVVLQAQQDSLDELARERAQADAEAEAVEARAARLRQYQSAPNSNTTEPTTD